MKLFVAITLLSATVLNCTENNARPRAGATPTPTDSTGADGGPENPGGNPEDPEDPNPDPDQPDDSQNPKSVGGVSGDILGANVQTSANPSPPAPNVPSDPPSVPVPDLPSYSGGDSSSGGGTSPGGSESGTSAPSTSNAPSTSSSSSSSGPSSSQKDNPAASRTSGAVSGGKYKALRDTFLVFLPDKADDETSSCPVAVNSKIVLTAEGHADPFYISRDLPHCIYALKKPGRLTIVSAHWTKDL